MLYVSYLFLAAAASLLEMEPRGDSVSDGVRGLL